MSLLQLLSFIFLSEYSLTYYRLFFILILISFNGIIIFHLFFRQINKVLLVGGGMITGLSALLLLLGIFSYILKGPQGIGIIFLLYTMFCVYLFIRNLSLFRNIFIIHFSRKKYFLSLIILFFLFLIFLYGRSAPAGGDVSTHWSLATSFARGNYPTVLPWQPDRLTAYHEGGFMVEGAIYALANTHISLVHFFFSFYIISAIFLFTTGISISQKLSLWAIIPSVFGLILFGGPIFYIGSLGTFTSSLFPPPTEPPLLSSFKNGIGSGANDFSSLYYYNFYTFGLATFILLIYTLCQKWNKSLLKFFIATTISVLSLSIMETFFIPEIVLIAVVFFSEYRKKRIRVFITHFLICIFIFSLLFLTIQNLIRDTLLSPEKGATNFVILTPNNPLFITRWNYMKGAIFKPPITKGAWYLLDIRITILISIVLLIITRNYLGIFFIISCIVTLILSLLINDPFFSGSALRFTHTAYQLLIFSIGFFLCSLLQAKNKKFLIGLVFFFCFFPQLISNGYYFAIRATTRDDGNYIRYSDYKNPTLEWIKQNIPYNKKIFFVEEYPSVKMNLQLTPHAFMFYGMFIPSGPIRYKLISVDFAGEWYDAVMTLSPKAFKDLSIDYVFIKQAALSRFSEEKKRQLNNIEYFIPIYKDYLGTLFIVRPSYKELPDSDLTLKNITDSIPDNSVVYLDRFPIVEIRKGLLVELSERTKLIGPRYNLGGDYFLYISANLHLEPLDGDIKIVRRNLDSTEYVLKPPEGEFPDLLSKDEFKPILESPQISLLKKIK